MSDDREQMVKSPPVILLLPVARRLSSVFRFLARASIRIKRSSNASGIKEGRHRPRKRTIQ